jgi:hypothetical protein
MEADSYNEGVAVLKPEHPDICICDRIRRVLFSVILFDV